MGKKRLILLITAMCCLIVPLVELILCFRGPFVLDVKSTCYIFPLYNGSLSREEGARIDQALGEGLRHSRKYILVDRETAEKVLEDKEKNLGDYLKKRSSGNYADAARIIGTDKFIMGYVLKNGETVEVFVELYLTRLGESVRQEKLSAVSFQEALERMPELITRLDGDPPRYSLQEMLYFLGLFLVVLFGCGLLFQVLRPGRFRDGLVNFVNIRMPEVLFLYLVMIFSFSYLYALNANMDYVQKFMATGGNLRMAQNTEAERFRVMLRFLPLLILTGFSYIYLRINRKSFHPRDSLSGDFRVLWALPLALLSSFLCTLALPSFLSLDGWGFLAFVGLIPLLMVFEKNSLRVSVFYGVMYGWYRTMYTNYWLGTFSLVSLQVVLVIFLVNYFLFMLPGVWIYKNLKKSRFIFLPFIWTFFEFFHSGGFSGYPWGLLGTSQYENIPLIQVASLTGVWGITFLVVLVNTALYESGLAFRRRERSRMILPLGLAGGLMVLSLIFGAIYLGTAGKQETRHVRVAVIQDSIDPRKHNGQEVLEGLLELTDQVLEKEPEIIFWPEGAFDADVIFKKRSSRKLVDQLLNYVREKEIWLLTGGMDVNEEKLAAEEEAARLKGEERDKDKPYPAYNSSQLIDPRGELKDVYHKIHLVPFTEYFPYEKELPWLYEFLKDFDVNWWEKGERQVIFRHPEFTFFTPICFEDVFPREIADFVRTGGDVIGVISNDYWSLSPVEGKQHGITALFRAVENRRTLLRATTSGLSCLVDKTGRIRTALPPYESSWFVEDIPVDSDETTLYTLWGDWFPLTGGLVSLGAGIFLLVRRAGRRSGKKVEKRASV